MVKRPINKAARTVEIFPRLPRHARGRKFRAAQVSVPSRIYVGGEEEPVRGGAQRLAAAAAAPIGAAFYHPFAHPSIEG